VLLLVLAMLFRILGYRVSPSVIASEDAE